MTEQERADWLARAVDALIHKTGEKPDAGTKDQELLSLLRVAESQALRARQRLAATESGHQARVWDNVLARLTESAVQLPEVETPPDDAAEMAKTIAARRKLSEEMMEFAEQFRDDVWARVKHRVSHAEEAIGQAPAWLLRTNAPAPTLSSRASVPFSSGDPHFDSLVRVALAHGPAAGGGSAVRGGIPVGARPGRRPTPTRAASSGLSHLISTGLALGAGVAILIAAVGPLPATGVADHPAVRAVNKAREVVVATESSSPPPVGSGTIVTGVEVTLSEARLLTGLPVTQPTAMTTGFRLLVSQYYPATITAREGGLFALTYENGSGASISIYQEAGTENDLSVAGGASVTTLSGGQTATYFFGHWQEAGDGMLSWQDGQSQTLTYAWNGVRVIIQYSGPHIHSQLLVDIANNMVGQPQ